MFCEKCGKQIPEGAAFCPYCGAKVEVPFAPKQEVVDPKPHPEAKKEEKKTRYTDEEIQKMKYELADHRRRQSNFAVAGGVLLGVGLALFVVGLIIFISSTVAIARDGEAAHSVGIVFGYLGLIFGSVMWPIGVVLLIIGNAVFGSKANNRERAIKEHEQGK